MAIDWVCGLMLVLSGILMMAVGKMRFTPIMFILMGFLSILICQDPSIQVYIAAGVMFIVLGLFAVFRKESRILPAIMLIIYGVSCFFAGSGVLSGVLNLIPALIAVYLAFAVFSQSKNLKLI